jgi:peptide-methionine (S)-S-oxide reductase
MRLWASLLLISITASGTGASPSASVDSHARRTSRAPTTTAGKKMTEPTKETAVLAGGCFWCLEAVFEQLEGVDSVVSGYTGGKRPNPTYEQVCTGATGHAEAIQLTYDPKKISYHDLLEFFFAFHDPTTLDRQGNDEGTQYRSAIFYAGPEQKKTAEEMIARLTREKVFHDPIVTQVVPLTTFYAAERYHQGYYRANSDQPYCRVVIGPKVSKLRAKYQDRLKRAPTTSP